MNATIIYAMLLFCFYLPIGGHQDTPSVHAIDGVFTKIAHCNLQLFKPPNSENWHATTFEELVRRAFKERLNPEPYDKRSMAFKIFQKYEARANNNDANTWNDLDFFYGNGTDKTIFLGNKLNRSCTELGTIALYGLLAQPQATTSNLLARQNIIKTLLNDPALYKDIIQHLSMIGATENALLSFWGPDWMHNRVRDAYLINLSPLKQLNQKEMALWAHMLYDRGKDIYCMSLQGFIALILLAYGIITETSITPTPNFVGVKTENQFMDDGVMSYLWRSHESQHIRSAIAIVCGLYAGYNAYKSAQHIKGLFVLEQHLQMLMMHIADTVYHMQALHKCIQRHPLLAHFSEYKELANFFQQHVQRLGQLNDLRNLLSSTTFQGQASTFSHVGAIIKSYLLMHEMKDHFSGALSAIGIIDAYSSIVTLIKEHANKPASFCFATYATAEKPFINLKYFWHPFIDPDSAITNSMFLGTSKKLASSSAKATAGLANGTIKEPNEGDRSTMLKAIAIALVMAQTIGIAPAKSMAFTPFYSIATYLNIKESLRLYPHPAQRGIPHQHIVLDIVHNQGFACSIIDNSQTLIHTMSNSSFLTV